MASDSSFRTYTEWWQWVLLCLFLVGVVVMGYIAWFRPDELTRPSRVDASDSRHPSSRLRLSPSSSLAPCLWQSAPTPLRNR
jgi:hypothetical protein